MSSYEPIDESFPVAYLRDITQIFPGRLGRQTVALNSVTLTIHRGEVLAIVGESGSGKSTLGLVAAGLLKPSAGDVQLGGGSLTYTHKNLKTHHRKVQLILQNPFTSLNPVHTVLHHLARPLKLHHGMRNPHEIRLRASELLDGVGLVPSDEYLDKYPHQLSGGQRQRVGIARALATQPKLIVADEPTSMLDVSLRLDMLNLLLNLRNQHGTSFLFITHDLASAYYVADTIAVLFRGNLVERGSATQIVMQPKHPYTQLLLQAITDVVPENTGDTITTEATPTGGCSFRLRCPMRYERCDSEPPKLQRMADGIDVSCHYVESREGHADEL